MKRQKTPSRRERRKERRRQETQEMHCDGIENHTPRRQPRRPLEAKTRAQGEYICLLQHKQIIFATGLPGTGKTYIAAREAARQYKSGEVKKIILVRPPVSDSESLGFFKGTATEKMMMWLAPVIGALLEEFSFSELEYMMKEDVGQIQCVPLETIKGASFNRSFIIVDEAEDITRKELIKIIPRIGHGSVMVLCGDTRQSDLTTESGLTFAIKRLENSSRLRLTSGWIDFSTPGTVEEGGDVVRSKPASDWITDLYDLDEEFESAPSRTVCEECGYEDVTGGSTAHTRKSGPFGLW